MPTSASRITPGAKALSGTSPNFTVTLSNCTGDGTVAISIAAGTATDTAGNSAAATGPSTSFTVDNTPPGISIGGPSHVRARSAHTVTYTLTYSGAFSISLAAANVTVNATGNATCAKAVSGSGTTTRTVTLTSCTGDGTVGISIAAGTALDAAGNSATAAGPSTTFIVDNTPPSFAITSPNGGNDWTTPGTLITFSGTCNSDVNAITNNFGATASDSNCSDGTWALNTTNLGWEQKTFTMTAIDIVGNSTSRSITITRQVVLGQSNQTSHMQGSTLSEATQIWSDGTKFAVSDPACHRILLFNALPVSSVQTADVVLGTSSPSACPSLPNEGGVSGTRFNNPQGISHLPGGRTVLADKGNNRVLIWNGWPSSHGQSANWVVGQCDMTSNSPNQGGVISAATLSSPTDAIISSGGKLIVADTGNNRVLVWNSVPTSNCVAADIVIGQSSLTSGTANAGGIAANRMAAPDSVAMAGTKLLVGDSGNKRILVFNSIPTTSNTNASYVVGQADFTSVNNDLSSSVLHGPTTVASDGTRLFAVDRNAHRVLVWNTIPTSNGPAANALLGQTGYFRRNPNGAGSDATNLYSPLGAAAAGGSLYVGDGNGRVMIYGISGISGTNTAATGLFGSATFADMAVQVGIDVPMQAVWAVAQAGTKFAAVDTDNNRVLLWNNAPRSSLSGPDIVLGQPDLGSTRPNVGGSVSASTLSSPQGVWLIGGGGAGTKVVVSDTLNHRVLIWNSWPTSNGQAADLVLGQPDMTSSSGSTARNGLRKPRKVWSDGTTLLIADQANSRVLGWNTFPTTNGQNAGFVLGQTDFVSQLEQCTRTGMSQPNDVWSDGTRIYVVEGANNRVLVWSSWPTTGQQADYVLGQSGFVGCTANRGGAVAANTLNAPSGIDVDEANNRIFIADTNNYRVLVFNGHPAANGVSANYVLGQTALTSSEYKVSDAERRILPPPRGIFHWTNGTLERLYVSNTGFVPIAVWNSVPTTNAAPWDVSLGKFVTTKRSAIAANILNQAQSAVIIGSKIAVADTKNNRVLIWNSIPGVDNANPSVVLGQSDFTSNLPNGGSQSATANSLWQPSQVATDGTRLIVADTMNNRVLIWNTLPTVSNSAASVVIGQSLFTTHAPNDGGRTAATLNNPTGVAVSAGRLLVADQGNNRVLIFNSIPATSGASANLVLGQASMTAGSILEPANAASLRQPSAVAVEDATGIVAVSDTNNNRVLVWTTFPTANGVSADVVLGQSLFTATGASAFGIYDLQSLAEPGLLSLFENKLSVWNSGAAAMPYWQVSTLASTASAEGWFGRTPGTTTGAPSESAYLGSGEIQTNGTLYLVPDPRNNRVLLRAASP